MATLKYVTANHDMTNLLVRVKVDICWGPGLVGGAQDLLVVAVHMNRRALQHCNHHSRSPLEVHVGTAEAPCDCHLLPYIKHILQSSIMSA